MRKTFADPEIADILKRTDNQNHLFRHIGKMLKDPKLRRVCKKGVVHNPIYAYIQGFSS